jgi:hypothetical protein
MNREELVKAVQEKLAVSEVANEAPGKETNAKPTVEVTTEQNQEQPEVVNEEANKKADVEKKTALQKRLDKLTREKFEAIERANELQRQLEEKSKPKEEIKSSLEVDEETNAFLRGLMKEIVSEELTEKQKYLDSQKAKMEQQEIASKFEEKLMLSLANEFSEETGEFSDKAKEIILTISDKFQKDPKWILQALDVYGLEDVYKLLTLSELPVKQVEKKDSIDKLLEKERLMKSAKPDSSNVTQRIEKQAGENNLNFLKRIIGEAAKKT